MMRHLLILAAGLALPLPALAQNRLPDTDPLREERQQQALEDRTNALGNLEPKAGLPDLGPAQEAGGPCFPINRITVTGATTLPRDVVQGITSRAAPACMDGAAIQGVMRQIDTAYAERGHITSKTYIPPQNLTLGQLELEVVEGRVEDVFLLDDKGQVDTPRGRRQLATAFPHAKDGIFQLRDFEQGLDQMNRLKSVEAALRLQPGDTEGGSYVLVQRVQTDRFRGWLRWDNMASDSTGRRRLALDVDVDDLFGANDTFALGYKGTVNTNALTLNGSVPYGYWTFSADLGYSEYLTPLNPLAELFGSSRSVGLNARYMLRRDQYSTTELMAGLDIDHSYRWINNVRLTPQRLTTVSFGIIHMQLRDNARDSWDGGITLGLPLFGADDMPSSAGRDIPKPRFAMLTFGWQRQAGLGDAGTLVTDLRGQVSLQSLYGNQQMALGSHSTVRGYDLTEASGDSGLYLRNDLYLAADFWADALPGKWRQSLSSRAQPYVFFDMGLTRDNARSVTETAAGLGAGASWYGERVTASALIGVPLLEDGDLKPGDPLVQLRVDVKAW